MQKCFVLCSRNSLLSDLKNSENSDRNNYSYDIEASKRVPTVLVLMVKRLAADERDESEESEQINIRVSDMHLL